MADTNERLRGVIARLEDCHAVLTEAGERDSAQLVAMTMLQIRMRLNHIGDAELRALCEAMTPPPDSTTDSSRASGDGGS